MDARGLKTKDVAESLHVDEATIRNWRSTGVPPRRVPHVERYMAEWTDPAATSHPSISDEEVTAFAESNQNLVLHPTEDEFDCWTAAFKASQSPTLKQWALDGLNELAAALSPVPVAVPKTKRFPQPSHSAPSNLIELPFLGAVAAGEPVEAPRSELLPVSKQFPPQHFIVEVNGSSMEPDYPDGSRWIIDGRDKFTPKHGAVCVVSDGSGSYLKRWNKRARQFESINPDFNQILPSSEAKLQGYPVERYAAP